mgnify:CR=1 FL=1
MEMKARVAELVLKKCLGYRPGESVVLVTDTELESVAKSFLSACNEIEIEVTLLQMSPRTAHGDEPTGVIASIVLLLTTKSLSHTQARINASAAGVRIASMPAPDPARIEYLLDIDYGKLSERGEAIASQIRGGRVMRLTSKEGTDLTFEIENQPLHVDGGDLTAPGSFGNLPAGEVYLSPVIETARGVLMVDGSMSQFGEVTTPVRIDFKNGRPIQIGDPTLREWMESHGEDAFHLAEVGMGTNPRAEVIGNIVEDEKAIGTVHIALGTNISVKGSVYTPLHLDLVLKHVEIEVDNKSILPEFLPTLQEKDHLPPPSAPLPELVSGESYRMLFENANDAQYILDMDTQLFLDVNPTFQQMTGFTKEELIEKGTRAGDIVARESQDTYKKKRETRRITPSDRYDLRLICKNGERKPTEISVRRVQLRGKNLIIGTIRDLTERKRLEQDMWEKIEELGYANNRIFSLTEKIRCVPRFTPELLYIANEEDLLRKSATLLCARDGLAYSSVTFYLVKGEELILHYSTEPQETNRIPLTDTHRFVRILQGKEKEHIDDKGAILPLKGRDRNWGIIEVTFHPKEIELLAENKRTMNGYKDLLITLANMVGLLVENLKLYETVRRQSLVDQLTGIFNRRLFDRKIKDEVERARRYKRDLSLLLIDLDNFKPINDTLGHRQGDKVLQEAAQFLNTHIRGVDTVCRYGGDEFVIMMPETSPEGASIKAETLRKEMEGFTFTNNVRPETPIKLTLSIGVAGFHSEVPNSDALIHLADEALYRAKQAGRNGVCCADEKNSTTSSEE